MEDDASIHFGPLQIWFFGRQFPESADYWDGNWLSGKAVFVGVGSRVEVSGAFIHLRELKKWKTDLESFQRSLAGVVELATIEPALKVKIEARKAGTGHFDCEVQITADQITEKHRYQFDSDQSYLPSLLTELSTVLRDYPIKNEKTG